VGLAKLLVAVCPPVSAAGLVLLVGAEVESKTPLEGTDEISAVTLEVLLGLLHELLHGAPAEGKRSHSALHAAAAGGDEVKLSLALGGESAVNGVVVGIAAVLLRVLESSVSGLVAELETIAHLDVSVATTNDLPNKRGGHLYAEV